MACKQTWVMGKQYGPCLEGDGGGLRGGGLGLDLEGVGGSG